MKMVAGCQFVNNVTQCAGSPFHLLGVLDSRVEGACVSGTMLSLFQAVSFLLFLFGVLGNIAYLAVMTRSYQELNTVDLFLVGLSALDVISSIFLPLFYFLEISDYLNNMSDNSCKFITAMYETSVVLTIYLLIFTVHAFYRNIVLGKSDGNRKLRFTVMLVFSVLLTIIPATPLIVDTHSHDGECHVDNISFSSAVVYDVVIFFIQVVIPVLFFTVVFTQLGLCLYRSRESHQGDEDGNVAVIHNSANRQKLGLLLLITCTFFILFIPFVLSNLWFLLDAGRILEHRIYCHLFDIFHLIICGKCVANPVIYLAYQEGFRENLKRVICGFRIGRRYNFMHIKYNFRRDTQGGIMDDQVDFQDNGTLLSEMSERQPQLRIVIPPPNPDLELNEKEHDYEDEEENGDDNVAILKPWKSFRSTSNF